jgi:hypothetical protein
LRYLEQFPCAYQNKQSIRGHITAAEGSMNAAKTALKDVEMNKRGKSYAVPMMGFSFAMLDELTVILVLFAKMSREGPWV